MSNGQPRDPSIGEDGTAMPPAVFASLHGHAQAVIVVAGAAQARTAATLKPAEQDGLAKARPHAA